MSLPGKKNLDVYRGDYHEWPLVINVNAGTEENPVLTPVDFTGHTFAAQFRLEPDSPVLASLDFYTTDISEGKVTPYLTHVKSAALPPGTYVWDFQAKAPNGRIRTWLAGKVNVTADVTIEEGDT